MKTKATKQLKRTNLPDQLKDLAAKKNPKGGAELLHEATHAQEGSSSRVRTTSGCDDEWGCGANHNETLVSESAG